MSFTSWGHLVFAVTMIMLGILGLVKGDFPPTWSGVPEALPAREVVAYFCAFASLVSGIGLLWGRARLLAARFLLVYLMAWLLLVRVSHILAAPTSQDAWWAAGDTAVMAAATWMLYASFTADRGASSPRFATGERGVRIARVLYGLALIPFGVAHFTYLKETVALVPGWLPAHTAWAYLTGGAFLAAGVAVLIGVGARLAATLSALQMGLFTLVVWVPVVLAGPTPFQWSEFIDSWALTAGAWVVADSYRGVPWLAAGRR